MSELEVICCDMPMRGTADEEHDRFDLMCTHCGQDICLRSEHWLVICAKVAPLGLHAMSADSLQAGIRARPWEGDR